MLLSEHWDKIAELVGLGSAHPPFERFVLRHTDVTMSLDQAKAIKQKAQEECPVEAKKLCEYILQRMEDFK